MVPNPAKRPPVLPDGRLPDNRPGDLDDPTALRTRIKELEALCAEVYVAAVELGLPQPLLNRLWTVAAQGATPHAFDVEMPPRTEPPARAPEAGQTTKQNRTPPLPDIRLTDRPGSRDADSPSKASHTELTPLPERRRVLVVDDDAMMLEVLVRILQRENYDLIVAASGPEALQKAAGQTSGIDLLITDYAMPEMQGRELAEKIRERSAAVKVLYQTGFSDMLFENRAELEEGAAFVEKPFTARGLREAVRLILFGAINPE